MQRHNQMYFASAILLIAMSLQSLPPTYRSQQQQPSADENNNAKSAISDNANSPDPQTNTAANQTKDGPQKPPYWDVTWATWALVIVGGVAALLALCTLRDIRKQTSNAGIAAKAALQNAQAFVNAERAWITINIEWAPGHSKPSPTYKNGDNVSNAAAIRVIYSNQGKIIARVNRIMACFRMMEYIPPEPDLNALEIIKATTEWIESKGERHIETGLRDDNIYRGEVVRIPVIWGVVRYSDAFGAHESFFGFSARLDNTLERLSDPTKYNDLT